MKQNLAEFCADGCVFREEMISVSENVSLRVITFSPPVDNGNPSVVLVPGWASMINGWKEVLLEMSKDFKIYYVETREKISSQVQSNEDFSVGRIGEDLLNLISILGLQKQKYILFGSSLGATSILDSCRFIKEDPICLVFVGPNAEIRIPRFGVVLINLFFPPLYLFFKPYVKWYLKTFRLDAKSDIEQYEKYASVLDSADPWKLKRAAKAVANYSVWKLLPSIKYPTLIVGASKDKLHIPENLVKMSAMMEKSTYIDLETNKRAHQKEVVEEMRKYLASL
ncbi:MAG: alpha/beta hydrolase [Bacteroidetes bacterium]|nr:alpha/beta hydrolase [Bacteroidota bacterium]MBU1678880.1 alpha/beta hydrolase [Bacteroidota bacterium]MBU2507272.1 alpha/beta hydrolase [Bacteroidota bacterium]